MKDLKKLPFDKLLHKFDKLDEFVKTYEIKDSWGWLANQLLAYLSNYKAPTSRDIKEFLTNNLEEDFDKGLWKFLVKTKRSQIMGKQTEKETLSVCALVPIHLAAQKLFNNIKYNEWTGDTSLVATEDLAAAMNLRFNSFIDVEFEQIELIRPPVEDVIPLRQQALVFAGKQQNGQTWHQLNHLKGTYLNKYPKLAKNMIFQTWCAHPANRNELMILDPWDWDLVPKSIIPTDLW